MYKINIDNNYNNKMSLYFEQFSHNTVFKTSETWVILSPIEEKIKRKIETLGTPLKEWDVNINYGIKTGFNEAFIIDENKKNELIEADPKSAEIIRPILRGRDIKRYNYNFANLWLINTHNGIKEKNVNRIFIEDYPAVKAHLDQYFVSLEKRNDKGDTAYNLRNCAYVEDFSKPKIIFQEMVQEPSFFLDKEGTYMCLDTARIITGDNLDILLLVMNSKLFFYSVKTFYGGGGLGETGVRMKHTFFENFPMPTFSQKTRESLKNIIANFTRNDVDAIDKIIYDYYNFSQQEIDFIEAQ
ncbi:TaqI-like C-terminal specificity domain-containing protein [Myroides odoratimimus]|uniref:TaqI-like C-terminal specificity domain-containing protein n=1 Tax=Myroides odoratimimus TaxID=76832 RepID=UPI0026E04A07|nr:TaqI-like C-terminal specificity domain-containing protein [Myroides odoratimimus]MDO5856988.1 TaqI-like C-terminal specificity domain-containing protein [Myroides odoratimimus]